MDKPILAVSRGESNAWSVSDQRGEVSIPPVHPQDHFPPSVESHFGSARVVKFTDIRSH